MAWWVVGEPGVMVSNVPADASRTTRYAGDVAVSDTGYPDVFAHGMLTAGVVERTVTGWLGLSRVSRLGARFTAPP